MGADPALDEAVAHGEREAEIRLPLGIHVLWQFRQRELEMVQELFPDGLGIKSKEVCLPQIFRLQDGGFLGRGLHHNTSFTALTLRIVSHMSSQMAARRQPP